MKTDRTTKLLLGMIAAGLWANVIISQVGPARAEDGVDLLRSIDNHLMSLAMGVCVNGKLC